MAAARSLDGSTRPNDSPAAVGDTRRSGPGRRPRHPRGWAGGARPGTRATGTPPRRPNVTTLDIVLRSWPRTASSSRTLAQGLIDFPAQAPVGPCVLVAAGSWTSPPWPGGTGPRTASPAGLRSSELPAVSTGTVTGWTTGRAVRGSGHAAPTRRSASTWPGPCSSAHAHPRGRPRRLLRQLDDLAAGCRAPTLDGLLRHLFVDQGFVGNQDDYYDPANSYLDEVLETHLGIPISLAVLTMEVGRRIGRAGRRRRPPRALPAPGPGRSRGVHRPLPGRRAPRPGRLPDRCSAASTGRTPSSTRPGWSRWPHRAILDRMLANLVRVFQQRGDAARPALGPGPPGRAGRGRRATPRPASGCGPG